ncbi:glycosyl hydrolase family 2 protein [Cohnella cholangitidis]|uniref:Alpha-L-rhamnosidase n=1 Tax=Cohnella cholangitidis TaxID=2598458 RepID=A0A7G5C448_9BACL|nr:glycosyl hydrolase [Cohnella cholangitidis]QMV43982.1 hypothetical protein FPL14_24510 [Cohnella cholangitidis]
MSIETITRGQFLNPPNEFRSVPFWALNDWLRPEEFKRQLQQFKDGGYGGAYLHSRTGLLTEYMGQDWWGVMDAGVEACRELGLEAWFYDEDKWPSGFAGGAVPKMNSDFRAKSLRRLDKSEPIPDNCEMLSEDEQYFYVCCTEDMGDPWFNGTSWVDLLNPDMVQAFIDCSYKPYAERYREEAGSGVVHGIFTDEPQVSPRPLKGVASDGAISYSPLLRIAFEAQHGYDIIKQVACLFENTGNFRKVRLDYYRTLGRVLEESFSRKLGEYCASAGIVLTGHYNGENYLNAVIRNVGNMMIQYRHMQRPGIDFLGRTIKNGNGMLAAKSLSSVANQYGLERRLTELFGIGGQNMSFEDRLGLGAWHIVNGINHFCPHLALYSMKGCRKRDFPPTLSPQQPYWKHNHLLEDYFARISYATTIGEFAPDLLVVSPLESAYMDMMDCLNDRNPGSELIHKRDGDFGRLLETLMAAQRDFDIGDEEIMSQIAVLENGSVRMGKMRYKALVLPFMTTIRKNTLELVHSFASEGGKVFVVGEFPSLVDGDDVEDLLLELRKVVQDVPESELVGRLAAEVPAAVELQGDGCESVWIQRRTVEQGEMIFFVNTSRLRPVTLKVTLGQLPEMPLIWDPADGAVQSVSIQREGTILLKLAEAQSLILTTGSLSRHTQIDGKYSVSDYEETSILSLDGSWNINRLDPNALTLDYARYSTDGGQTFSEPEPVIGIHARFTDLKYTGSLLLEYEFDIQHMPRHCAVVIEQPELFKSITVNGMPYEFADAGPYVDNAFRTSDIVSFLHPGINLIRLSLDYVAPVLDSYNAEERYGTEIESIYLIGDFALESLVSQHEPAVSQYNSMSVFKPMDIHYFSSFRLIKETSHTKGNLTETGYPFYAGSVMFEYSFNWNFNDSKGRKVIIRFPEIQATVMTGELNGHHLRAVAWSPWEMDLTDAIQEGSNTIRLTLVNTLRNILGPHHHALGELTRVGPSSFTGDAGWPNENGQNDWYDQRLYGKARLWRDDYSFVPFGFLKPPVIVVR